MKSFFYVLFLSSIATSLIIITWYASQMKESLRSIESDIRMIREAIRE